MKNKFKIFAVFFIACIFILGNSVYAFTNSDYSNNLNISIGLENMKSSQLSITLNGDYTSNGVVYKGGTSYVLKASGMKIDLNGKLYDNIIFIPNNNSNTIKIVSSYSRNYLGTLIFKIDTSSGTSKVMPVNTLYIEDYLKGVVGKEMSDYFPIEALKAQAVAARNYALANISKHKAKGYNLCDTVDCQVYGGYDASLKNVIAAVNATKGILLLSGTNLVATFYSASDGGYTEASENVWSEALSYLKAKQDSYDMNYTWNRQWTTTSIKTVVNLRPYLKIPVNYTFVKIDLNSITKFDSGRIKNIGLIFKDQYGLFHTLSYGKETARNFLSLPSALYNVTYDFTTDIYNFDGKGNGHGVGMSQIGAKNRADAGQNFETILKFYYSGTTLINASPKYTVTFNSQGGSTVINKSADYNSTITAPATPTKTGYTFGGWYKEASCINAWNFTTNRVTANTILYAKWTVVAPGIPTNLKLLSYSYNSINIGWSTVTGASGYEVYRATSTTGTYTVVSRTTESRYNNIGLTTNRTYYYKVRAYRMVGTVKVYSGYSTTISFKPIPSMPTSVKAVSSSYNSINVSWRAVTGASGYEVYRSTSSTGTYTLVARTTEVRYNNTGLTTNRTYYYKVRAYRMVGTVKVYSYFLTVVKAKPIPSTPLNAKATRISSKSIKLTWSTVTGANG